MLARCYFQYNVRLNTLSVPYSKHRAAIPFPCIKCFSKIRTCRASNRRRACPGVFHNKRIPQHGYCYVQTAFLAVLIQSKVMTSWPHPKVIRLRMTKGWIGNSLGYSQGTRCRSHQEEFRSTHFTFCSCSRAYKRGLLSHFICRVKVRLRFIAPQTAFQTLTVLHRRR